MNDDGLVVGGKGVGEVGDDDQDGGGQEGGQQAARQWPGKLKDHLQTRQTLKCCLCLKMSKLGPQYLKSGMAHFDACHSVLFQFFWSPVDEIVWDKMHMVFFLIQPDAACLTVKGEPEHIVVAHEFTDPLFSI